MECNDTPFMFVSCAVLVNHNVERTKAVVSRATILSMPTAHILSLLIAERDKLTRAIGALQGTPRRDGRPRKSATPTIDAAPTPNHTTQKRRWTAAMKRAAAERSKAMWATKRKAAKKG